MILLSVLVVCCLLSSTQGSNVEVVKTFQVQQTSSLCKGVYTPLTISSTTRINLDSVACGDSVQENGNSVILGTRVVGPLTLQPATLYLTNVRSGSAMLEVTQGIRGQGTIINTLATNFAPTSNLVIPLIRYRATDCKLPSSITLFPQCGSIVCSMEASVVSSGVCQLSVRWSSSVIPTGCGNGIVENTEQCDGGPCCSPTCTLAPAGTICRPKQTTCDLDEKCTGNSVFCPDDVYLPDKTSCVATRTRSGTCTMGVCYVTKVDAPTGTSGNKDTSSELWYGLIGLVLVPVFFICCLTSIAKRNNEINKYKRVPAVHQ
eukprot:NODE_4507_length_1157_cov_41.001934_g3989_i0.p1 GENE.NODE_4507_length_1157_cov_41.001934_g3989_i0~~NODE_4507_length_1157_cov_41.001934_g3989_i0.p1  ORF type:complete len:318 (-),score=64.17 NODE_4507_length_1157_cov_41.001934_g3989_i0:146-1099(-)